MANQGDAEATEPKPGVNPLSYSVSADGTEQINISNPNSETVTCTVKTGTEYCQVNNSGLITNKNTTSDTQTATMEVAIGTAKFTVNVTLYGLEAGGIE